VPFARRIECVRRERRERVSFTKLSTALPSALRSDGMTVIRVVLAEDNALLREGISKLIEAHDDIELVGTASNLPELLALIESSVPDVVVTDIRMPPTGTDEGLQAATMLRQTRPEVGVVVLSQYTAPAYALALLEHGSAGRAYLLKERVAGANELAQAIRTVASGGSTIDPLVVEELVEAQRNRQRSNLSWLTPRESEILGEMAQGKSNAAIASALRVSERAVEKHTNSIFAKLGLTEEKDVNRRVKAVLLYLSEPGGG
jgi:DNA-binding NarL/FixJ family response regulator